MFQRSNPHFPHRHNGDGSHDSICAKCFLTVASDKDEAELVQFERDHVCDPVLLDRFSQGNSFNSSFRNASYLAEQNSSTPPEASRQIPSRDDLFRMRMKAARD
jgi:hypothetical protein